MEKISRNFSFLKKMAILVVVFFSFSSLSAQSISPMLMGGNYWYNGDQVKYIMQPGGLMSKAGFQTIRIGGFGANGYTDSQFIEYVKTIKAMGATPIVQVKQTMTATQAAAFITKINITNGLGVKYWSIGNEPDHPDSGNLSDSIVQIFTKSIAAALKSVDPTITIIGGEYASYSSSRYANLLGGKFSITGKVPGKNYYYIDVIGFHRYGMTDVSDVSGSIDNLVSKVNAVNAARTDGVKLRWAMGEFNSCYDNNPERNADYTGGLIPANQKTWSFNNGQLHAQIWGYGMKKEAFYLCTWATLEGEVERYGTDLSLFERNYNGRSSYYHALMLGQNMKANYAPSFDNQTNVSIVAMKDNSGAAVMIMNKSTTTGYNYSLKLNNVYGTTSPLQIAVDAGIDKELTGSIIAESTQMLVFDAAGNLIKKYTYSRANADAQTGPTVSVVPTVAFTTPVSNSVFTPGSSLAVNVAATSSAGIANVQLYLNDILVRQEGIAPYDWGLAGQNDVALTNLASGTYVLKAIATGNDGGVASTETTFKVLETPVVSFTTPTNNSVLSPGSSLAVNVAATSGAGIANVQLYMNNTLVRQEGIAPYDWGLAGQNDAVLTNLASGTYVLKAIATGIDGGVNSTETTFVVNSLPSVSITAPTTSTVITINTPVVVNATASDSDGSISKVDFYNGTTLIATDTSAPYSCSWTPTTSGATVISAVATDNNSGETKVDLNVTVNKQAQTITFASLADRVVGDADYSPLASASSGLAVTYTSSNTAVATIVNGNIHLVGAGTTTITASQSGNTTYNSAADVQNVLKVNIKPTVTFTTPANNIVLTPGASLVVNVAATSTAGISNVQLYLNNSLVRQENIAPYDWGLAGQNDAALTNLASGTYVLKAIATGIDGGVNSTETTFVVNSLPSVSITAPTTSTVITINAPVVVNATASDSDGSISKVDFYNGTTLIATDTSAPYSCSWTPTTSGATVISAVATDNNSGETKVDLNVTVNKQAQTITFASLADKVVGDADYSPLASASSGLVVMYTSSNTAVATIVNGNIHLVGAGTTTITASQSGNATYNSAADVQNVLKVDVRQTIGASEDTYVDGGFPTSTFGSETTLIVKNSPTIAYKRKAFVKIDLSSFSSITNAKIRLYVNSISASCSITAYQVTDSWSKVTLTYNNAPAAGAAVSTVVVGTNPYYEWDITAYAQSQVAGDKIASLIFDDPNTADQKIVFNSNESTSKPEVIVVGQLSALKVKGLNNNTYSEGSIPTTQETEMKIFPNPIQLQGVLTIKGSDISKSNLLKIFDMSGKLVYSESLKNIENNISIAKFLKRGFYVVEVGGMKQKLVVN